MKLPANYADVRMEQLLQRIQTNFVTAKDEDLKRMIIELLLYVLDVMESWIRVKAQDKNARIYLKQHIEERLDGCSSRDISKSFEIGKGYAD